MSNLFAFAGTHSLVALIITACLWAWPAGAQSVDDARFKRVNLVVADMDRALAIYRDILGFTIDTLNEGKADSYSYPIFKFPEEAQLRFATLSAGDEQIRTFGLTEVKGIEIEPVALPYRVATVLRVNDIEKVISQIQGLGLDVVEPHSDITTDGVPFTEQAFIDYDGHMILLYELEE